MKHALAIAALLMAAGTARAQTFTQRIQAKEDGKGTLTITHARAIDDLVNGAGQTKAAEPAKPEQKPAAAAVRDTPAGERPHRETGEAGGSIGGGMDIPVVDMRRKVMAGSVKVSGYRVQVFAGGNTRADKQKAQRAGEAVKMKHPGEPVYVHFYSPRWICRVGNYRTYAEAADMLRSVRAMGYKQASIVKGKITVQQ